MTINSFNFDQYVNSHNYVSTAAEKSCKNAFDDKCGILVKIFLDHGVVRVNISGKHDESDHNRDRGVHTW